MRTPSAVSDTSVSRLAPLSASSAALRQSASVVAGKRIPTAPHAPPPSMKLGKPWNRSGDFAHHLIARIFARVGEDFLSDRLDLLHAEAQAQQFRAQRHQPAPAHRSARHTHQALQAYAHPLAPGLRARGDNGGKRRRLFEQVLDGFLGRLALDEIANQSDGLTGDVRAQVRGGRDAGY